MQIVCRDSAFAIAMYVDDFAMRRCLSEIFSREYKHHSQFLLGNVENVILHSRIKKNINNFQQNKKEYGK